MDIGSIAAMSVIHSQAQLQSQVGVSVLKKAMDLSETSNQILINSLVPPSPGLGANVDIKV